MPTITVTDELINIIKSERKLRNFKSGDLSKILNKNTSFISQLENGRIRQLDLRIFHGIFEKLIPDDKGRSEFVSDLLKQLSVKLTKDEIKKQVWMATFDLQFRLIPIPEGIIEFLKDKTNSLEEKGFTAKNIIDKVNLNEGLTEDLKENQVYAEYSEDGELSFSIKFKLEDSLIENIINKTTEKISYIYILGIINAIYKLEGHNTDESYDLAQKTLYSNRFYKLIEKNSIIKQENKELLSKQDKDFLKLRNELISQITYLGDKDVEYINKRLSVLLSNLNVEQNLTLALIGVSLVELKDVDRSKKQDFINEYREMIQRYKNSANEGFIDRLD